MRTEPLMFVRSALVLSLALATACKGEVGAGTADLDVDDVTSAPLVVVDTIFPEQDSSYQVIRVSGTDFDAGGRFLIGDASEGKVGLFHPDGRRTAVIGRKGEGPGEFLQPRYPRFASDGRIYVADSGASTISVFTSQGAFEKRIRLPQISPIMGFEVIGDSLLVLTGLPMDDGREVLFVVDTLGDVVSRLLPIRDILPAGAEPSPSWITMRQFWLAASSDSAYVVSTLSDSLWAVSLHDHGVKRMRMPIPGYLAPVQSRDMPRTIQEISKWAETFHTAAPIMVEDGNLAVTFVKGVLNYGDPNILLMRRDGAWSYQTDVAPPVNLVGGRIISILDPYSDTTAFAVLGPQ